MPTMTTTNSRTCIEIPAECVATLRAVAAKHARVTLAIRASAIVALPRR